MSGKSGFFGAPFPAPSAGGPQKSPLHPGDSARIPAAGDLAGAIPGKAAAGNGQVVVGIKADGDAHERQLSGTTEVQ